MSFLINDPYDHELNYVFTVPAGSLTPDILPHHSRFIYYLQFERGESLTSWLLRLASANGISKKSIWMESGLKFYVNDLDLHTSIKQWSVIERFIKTAKEREYGYDALAILYAYNDEPYVKYLTRHNNNLVFRFCPCCLSECMPYFRAKWRLNFYVMCEKHYVVMSDCCECGHPLDINKMREREKYDPCDYYCYCRKCGRDLRHQKPRQLPKSLSHASIQRQQDRLWNILESGVDRIGQYGSTHIISAQQALERYIKPANPSNLLGQYEFSYTKLFNKDIAAMFDNSNHDLATIMTL